MQIYDIDINENKMEMTYHKTDALWTGTGTAKYSFVM